MVSSLLPVRCLSHIGITVTDLDAARAFYADTLGFTVLYDDVEAGWTRLGMGLGDIVVELFSPHPDTSSGPVDPFYPASYGRPKIALTVDDVEAAFATATRAGLPVLCEIVTTRASRFFFITDPDGTLVQLQEFVSGRHRLAGMFETRPVSEQVGPGRARSSSS